MLNNEHQYLYLDALTSPVSHCNDLGISHYCTCRINRPIGYVWVIMLILSSQCCPNQAYLPKSLTIVQRCSSSSHFVNWETCSSLWIVYLPVIIQCTKIFLYFMLLYNIEAKICISFWKRNVKKKTNYNYNTTTYRHIPCVISQNFLWCNAHTYIIPPTIYMYQIWTSNELRVCCFLYAIFNVKRLKIYQQYKLNRIW